MSISDIGPLWFALSFCGFGAFIALMTVLFVRDGKKVVEPEPDIDWTQLEGDLRIFVKRQNASDDVWL